MDPLGPFIWQTHTRLLTLPVVDPSHTLRGGPVADPSWTRHGPVADPSWTRRRNEFAHVASTLPTFGENVIKIRPTVREI